MFESCKFWTKLYERTVGVTEENILTIKELIYLRKCWWIFLYTKIWFLRSYLGMKVKWEERMVLLEITLFIMLFTLIGEEDIEDDVGRAAWIQRSGQHSGSVRRKTPPPVEPQESSSLHNGWGKWFLKDMWSFPCISQSCVSLLLGVHGVVCWCLLNLGAPRAVR